MVHMLSHFADFQGRLQVINDPGIGVHGIIAIHSTVPGPAAGGLPNVVADSVAGPIIAEGLLKVAA